MLTKLEKRAFQMHSTIFSWQLPYPLAPRWNGDYSELLLLQPFWKWTPWVITTLNLIPVGMTCIAMVIYFTWIRPRSQSRSDFELINQMLLAPIGLVLSSLGIIFGVGTHHRYNLANTITNIIKQEIDLKRSNRQNDERRQHDANGIALCFLMAIAAVFPYAVVSVTIIFDLDPLPAIYAEFLTNLRQKGTGEIIGILIFRAIYLMWMFTEVSRSGSFCLACALIWIDRCHKICKVLMQPQPTLKFVRYYTRLTLIYRLIDQFVCVAIYLLLFMGFWVMVALLFIVVRMNQVIPLAILTIVLCMLILLGALHLFGLPRLCHAADMLELVVRLNIERAKIRFIKTRIKWCRWNLVRVKAVMPVRFKYGTFHTFGKEFKAEYFKIFMDRSLDAILL